MGHTLYTLEYTIQINESHRSIRSPVWLLTICSTRLSPSDFVGCWRSCSGLTPVLYCVDMPSKKLLEYVGDGSSLRGLGTVTRICGISSPLVLAVLLRASRVLFLLLLPTLAVVFDSIADAMLVKLDLVGFFGRSPVACLAVYPYQSYDVYCTQMTVLDSLHLFYITPHIVASEE